jgi:hypothetical protein
VPAATAGDRGRADVREAQERQSLGPRQINKVVTIDFVIDSGASDITLPRDVYLTLIRSGTLTSRIISARKFGIADGSEVKAQVCRQPAGRQPGADRRHRQRHAVGLGDPVCSADFLSASIWAIDNGSGPLKLIPKAARRRRSPPRPRCRCLRGRRLRRQHRKPRLRRGLGRSGRDLGADGRRCRAAVSGAAGRPATPPHRSRSRRRWLPPIPRLQPRRLKPRWRQPRQRQHRAAGRPPGGDHGTTAGRP